MNKPRHESTDCWGSEGMAEGFGRMRGNQPVDVPSLEAELDGPKLTEHPVAQCENPGNGIEQDASVRSRRSFLKGVATAASLTVASGDVSILPASAQTPGGNPAVKKPNIVLYVADQFRWDFIGAYGLNPSVKTPNLDKIFREGTAFTSAVTNQPVCGPSRSCMMTGRYATETGMWKNNLQMRRDLPTLATVLRDNGYTANFIGKWHLSGAGLGMVPAEDRGGFLDLWEGGNTLAASSQAYSGTIWDAAGQPITWHDQYRADFITDRAVRFLKSPQKKPFLLYISQQEPHFQGNGVGILPPRGYAERYRNHYVPEDLLHLPGNWQEELPGYYACVEKIDESVGTILRTLEEQGQIDNTIFVFTSDHGCQFHTRNAEDKRSPHDSSIRVPLLYRGPGFDSSLALQEIVGNISLAPTLIDGAGLEIPSSMKGKSLLPLIKDPQARRTWTNSALIQISESEVGRAIRTKEWTYCAVNATLDGKSALSSMQYEEYQMYNNSSDPAQLVNLAGREPFRNKSDELREELLQLIVDSGEPKPEIIQARLYP